MWYYLELLWSVEHFGEIGGEKLLSGDEDKRQEGESDSEDVTMSVKKDAPKAVSIQETTITITSRYRCMLPKCHVT